MMKLKITLIWKRLVVKKWEENDYNIISMTNDFATIYGNDVVKVDFYFVD